MGDGAKDPKIWALVTLLVALFTCVGTVMASFVESIPNLFKELRNPQSVESPPGTAVSGELIAGTSASPVPSELPLRSSGSPAFDLEDLESWQVVLADDFELDSRLWPQGERLDDFWRDLSFETTGGYYRVTARLQNSGVSAYAHPGTQTVTDFALLADARLAAGTPGNIQYGLAFRIRNERNMYQFVIRDDGYFMVEHISESGTNRLAQWQSSAAIRPGESNRIGVIGVGSTFVLTINDEMVAEVVDNNLPLGHAGFILSPGLTDELFVVDFDNYRLLIPPE